ncbi:MAG: 4'-phosphopantetheinyl transferase superfamily protein [Lentimicrobiaceae bacterium]|nr:4'-phosphopantetheinyl transferase superfamily protein [Lentimicrobiaceae bacterium]
MTEVYAIKLLEEATFEKLRPELLKLLPAQTCNKVNAFHHSNDSQRSLLGELLARQLLKKATGGPLPHEAFMPGEKGKPAHQGIQGVHFNITHSGEWVAVAISSNHVGVDVEKIRRIPDGVARRFFSELENQWLDAAKNEDERKEIFFTLWTLKESFLKAIGKGLTKSLSSFTILQKENHEFVLEQDEETLGYHLHTYPFREGYKLSVCAKNKAFKQEVSILKIKDLIENNTESYERKTHGLGLNAED